MERARATSQWIDYLWRPVTVLPGVPDAEPWTKLTDDGERATFYVGSAEIELLSVGHDAVSRQSCSPAPRHSGSRCVRRVVEPPYSLHAVTADSAEGEALTEMAAISSKLVPMPDEVADVVAQFVTEHHVERVFFKRKREEADPEVARAALAVGEGSPMNDPEDFFLVGRVASGTAAEETEHVEPASPETAAKNRPPADTQESSARDRERRREKRKRRPKPPSIIRNCRRSNRSRRKPIFARFSRPAFRRNSPARRSAARGSSIRRSATSSRSPKINGTSRRPVVPGFDLSPPTGDIKQMLAEILRRDPRNRRMPARAKAIEKGPTPRRRRTKSSAHRNVNRWRLRREPMRVSPSSRNR